MVDFWAEFLADPWANPWEIANLAIAALLGLQLAFIAVNDLTNLRISNRSVLLALGLALAWQFTRPGPLDWTSFVAAAAIFAVTMTLFFLGVFGGGDAKALPVTGLVSGYAALPLMLYALSFAGLALVAIYLALRLFRRVGVRLPGYLEQWVARRQHPYGIAIAAAAAVALWVQLPY